MRVPLSQGYEATIDDEDYAIVASYRWHVFVGPGVQRYAVAIVRSDAPAKYTTVRMHRLILPAQKEQRIDHINGDGLDNRKGNLRFATQSQNLGNSHKKRSAWGSQYKGVSRYRQTQRWTARIKVNYQTYWLGYFDSEEMAAKAYDAAARRFFGVYARVNFPGQGEAGVGVR